MAWRLSFARWETIKERLVQATMGAQSSRKNGEVLAETDLDMRGASVMISYSRKGKGAEY